MNDFRKYATKHLGMDGLVLDDVMKVQSQYMNPYILEERQLNVTQMDVFSRLMMDRIIFLGTEVNDYTANTLQHHAVRVKRRGNHLHRHGCIDGCCSARSRC